MDKRQLEAHIVIALRLLEWEPKGVRNVLGDNMDFSYLLLSPSFVNALYVELRPDLHEGRDIQSTQNVVDLYIRRIIKMYSPDMVKAYMLKGHVKSLLMDDTHEDYVWLEIWSQFEAGRPEDCEKLRFYLPSNHSSAVYVRDL